MIQYELAQLTMVEVEQREHKQDVQMVNSNGFVTPKICGIPYTLYICLGAYDLF